MENNHCQQREELLLNALEEAAILLDQNGRIQHANPVACKGLGYTLEQLRNQQLHDHFVINEQETDNTQAICLKPIDNGVLKTSFVCGNKVQKIHLPSHDGQATVALIWCPMSSVVNTHDNRTGLPDRNMLIHQLSPLLAQTGFSSPHSFVKIQIAGENNTRLNDVDPEQFESLITDLTAILSPNIRQRDLLARTGADNFVLLLRGCDLAHALSITTKLMTEIASYHEDYPDTNLPTWRACTGIIPLVAGHTVEETFEQAKKACQEACQSNTGIAVIATGAWENLDESNPQP